MEAEELRDAIASGFNKLFEASIVATLFEYNEEELDKFTKLLTGEMSKTLVGIRTAWGIQEEAFQSNLPLMNDKINKNTHSIEIQWGLFSIYNIRNRTSYRSSNRL